MKDNTILVTGAAGFIGFHIAKKYLDAGCRVIGIDNLDPYYSVPLKLDRLALLKKYSKFTFHEIDICDDTTLECKIGDLKVEYIIHLAAQAGVRYSIEHPMAYTKSNLLGFANILELARKINPRHLLFASTSSVYGSNTEMPFKETIKCDEQLSFYAATKKSNEIMAQAYAHTYGIPITAFRFFTVYGPWGRPDMALFKFTKAILNNQTIDVYNNGNMQRDFTYIDDLVTAIQKLTKCVPIDEFVENDSKSSIAPFRIVNIGNNSQVSLMTYIETLEKYLGENAEKQFLPMQQGDVQKTYAATDLLFELTKFTPSTSIDIGIQKFLNWYRGYYGV